MKWRVWSQPKGKSFTLLRNGIRVWEVAGEKWSDIGTVEAKTQLSAFPLAKKLPLYKRGWVLLIEPEPLFQPMKSGLTRDHISEED